MIHCLCFDCPDKHGFLGQSETAYMTCSYYLSFQESINYFGSVAGTLMLSLLLLLNASKIRRTATVIIPALRDSNHLTPH